MYNRFIYIISVTFFLTLFISSCAHVYFEEPQPSGGELLRQVPNELHGQWEEGLELVEITQDGISSRRIQVDSLTNAVDTLFEFVSLSDTFRLYRAKEFYVLNYKESDKPWEIAVLQKKKDGIYLFESRDPYLFKPDKNLQLKEVHFVVDDRDTIVHSLDIDFEGKYSFESATFTGQITRKTLKKIAKKENLVNILRSDGSVYVPTEEE